MRKTIPFALALCGAALLDAPLHAAPDAYVGPNGGDWNTVTNWSANVVPNSSDGNFYDVTNTSANTVVHSTSNGPNGVDTINSLNFSGTGGLTLSGLGDVIAGAQANSASVFSVSGLFTMSGGSLSNFTLMNSDAVIFSAPGTSNGNTLTNIILSGGLTIANATVHIAGTFAYGANAVFDLSNNGILGFSTTATLANATLKMGGSKSLISPDSSSTVTLDPTLTVSGKNANFNGGPLVSNTLLSCSQGGLWQFTEAISFTNNATTEARSGTVSLSVGEFNNNGIFQAANGATASATETTLINTGTFQALSGGTLTLSPFSYNANTLGTATVSGVGSRLNLAGGSLTLGQGENLTATNGGVIALQTTLLNGGKTFDPLAYGPAGTFIVSNGSLSGGTLANSDSQNFSGTNCGLTNVALSGGLSLASAAATVKVQGTFTHPTGAVFDLGTASALSFASATTLDNAAVKFGGQAAELGAVSATLTLGPNLVLQGGQGIIGPNVFSNGTLINQTTIVASGSSPNTGPNVFSIQTSQANNQGTISSQQGGYFIVSSSTTFTNAATVSVTVGSLMAAPGYTQTAGQTVVDGQLNVSTSGPLTIQAGALNGTGTLSGSVSNTAGTVKPGDSLGTFTISGAYTQGSGGTFLEQLGGTGAGQYGVLSVGGAAALGGTLDIGLLNGYTPTLGQTFTFLSDGSQSGTFTSVVALNIGYGYSVAYGANAAVLTVTTAAPEPSSGSVFGLGALGMVGLICIRRRSGV